MSKNLVVCCDGTDDEFGKNNTNVVRLYSVLVRQADRQVAFYAPGLGTFPAPGALTPVSKWLTQTMGSAFGLGLSHSIAISYRFLMENHAPGDRIYLFGFSRGAYAVRVLAALIHACGLMNPQNRNLIPYAIDLLGLRKFLWMKLFGGPPAAHAKIANSCGPPRANSPAYCRTERRSRGASLAPKDERRLLSL